MRLAFSSLACPGWTVEDIASAATNYGYLGIEWRLADGDLLGPQTDAGVWDRIASSGVPAICLDTSCVFVRSSDAKRDETIADAVAMAKHAQRIGAPSIRVFGGKVPDDVPRDDIVGPARDALQRAADAMPDGVRILVETHDAWSTGADISELTHDIDVGVVWDVAHTVRAGEKPSATLAAIVMPSLVHVKDADGDTLTHLGDGTIPLADACAALDAIGYEGWLSVEWEKLWHPYLDDAHVALPHAARHLLRIT